MGDAGDATLDAPQGLDVASPQGTDAGDASVTDAACEPMHGLCTPPGSHFCESVLDFACPSGQLCCIYIAPPYGGSPIEPDGALP